MIGLLCFALAVVASPFKSKLRLEAENAVLRHRLNVVRRRLHGRVRLTNHDRWFFTHVCTENSNPDIMVMKSAKDGMRFDASGLLNWTRDQRIFVQ